MRTIAAAPLYVATISMPTSMQWGQGHDLPAAFLLFITRLITVGFEFVTASMVAGTSGVKLAHVDRVDHWGRHHHRAVAQTIRDLESRLEQGDQDRLCSPPLFLAGDRPLVGSGALDISGFSVQTGWLDH